MLAYPSVASIHNPREVLLGPSARVDHPGRGQQRYTAAPVVGGHPAWFGERGEQFDVAAVAVVQLRGGIEASNTHMREH